MGKNGNRCVIKCCPVGGQSCPGFQDLTYHIVCRTSKTGLLRRNSWQKAVGPSVNLFNGAYICSLHFAPEDFNVNKRTTLKPDALPKYYLDPQWESVGVCDGLPLNTSQNEALNTENEEWNLAPEVVIKAEETEIDFPQTVSDLPWLEETETALIPHVVIKEEDTTSEGDLIHTDDPLSNEADPFQLDEPNLDPETFIGENNPMAVEVNTEIDIQAQLESNKSVKACRANIRNDEDLWEKMSRLKNETIEHELAGNAYIAPDMPPSKSSNQSIIKIIKPVEVQRCIVKCCPLGYLTTEEEAKLGRKFYEIPKKGEPREIWWRALGYESNEDFKEDQKVRKNHNKVCSIHFDEALFSSTAKEGKLLVPKHFLDPMFLKEWSQQDHDEFQLTYKFDYGYKFGQLTGYNFAKGPKKDDETTEMNSEASTSAKLGNDKTIESDIQPAIESQKELKSRERIIHRRFRPIRPGPLNFEEDTQYVKSKTAKSMSLRQYVKDMKAQSHSKRYKQNPSTTTTKNHGDIDDDLLFDGSENYGDIDKNAIIVGSTLSGFSRYCVEQRPFFEATFAMVSQSSIERVIQAEWDNLSEVEKSWYSSVDSLTPFSRFAQASNPVSFKIEEDPVAYSKLLLRKTKKDIFTTWRAMKYTEKAVYSNSSKWKSIWLKNLNKI